MRLPVVEVLGVATVKADAQIRNFPSRGLVFPLLALALACLTVLPLKAQLTYSVNGDNTITITGYSGSPGNLIIPLTMTVITGYDNNNLPIYSTLPVTGIGDWAFQRCFGLTSVTIGNSVTSIGNLAFAQCSGLTNVVIGDSVTNIGQSAFYDCSSLTNVVIGNGVTSIGQYAFYDCSGLTSVTIGNSVTNIGDYAFYWCSGLTSVTIPNSVTSIGSYAFYWCIALTRVTIGNNVISIGSKAFYFCYRLKSVTIPNSVTSIGQYAFYDCSGLTNVVIGNSVTSIGEGAFYYCSGLTSVTIPNSVTSMGYYVFFQCSGLHQVYFEGNSPTYYDVSEFSGSTGTVYYLPGTLGWGGTWGGTIGGWPTAQWYQPQPKIISFSQGTGVQNNGFQFTVCWATNATVVVEASTNLQNWTAACTNTLVSGTNYFSDAGYTNFSKRFYRVRSQ